MKKLRALGKITEELEPLLFEMCCNHDLQHAEIINLIAGWLNVHYPEGKEVYHDDTSPILFYGPVDKLRKQE